MRTLYKTRQLFAICICCQTSVGCSKPEQIDYSRWKNVTTDVDIALPPIKIDSKSELTLSEWQVKSNTVIRFRGSLVRKTKQPSAEVVLSMNFLRRYEGKNLSFSASSTSVSLANGHKGNFELFIKAPPNAGSYNTQIRVNNDVLAVGVLRVRRKP